MPDDPECVMFRVYFQAKDEFQQLLLHGRSFQVKISCSVRNERLGDMYLNKIRTAYLQYLNKTTLTRVFRGHDQCVDVSCPRCLIEYVAFQFIIDDFYAFTTVCWPHPCVSIFVTYVFDVCAQSFEYR